MFSLKSFSDVVSFSPEGAEDRALGTFGWVDRISPNDLLVANFGASKLPRWFFATMAPAHTEVGMTNQPFEVEWHNPIKVNEQTLVSAGEVLATIAEFAGEQYTIVQKVPRHCLVFILKEVKIEGKVSKVIDRMAWTLMYVTEMVRGSVSTLVEREYQPGEKPERKPLFEPDQVKIVPLGTEIHNNARDFGIVYYRAQVVAEPLDQLPELPTDVANVQYEWMKVTDFGKGNPNPWVEELLEEEGYSIVYPKNFELSTAQDGFGPGMMFRLRQAGLIK